jgi:hypothetical protein
MLAIISLLTVLFFLPQHFTTAFLPKPAPFWLINTFLQNKMYGRYPASPIPTGYIGTFFLFFNVQSSS